LAIGNNRADHLVAPAWAGPHINLFEQACLSHDFFHQSAKMLTRQFKISFGDAQGIVKSCPSCEKIGLGLGLGVNPRGLQPLQLWQMDVTHIPEFGQLKYVHVTVDTYSMVIWATVQ
ncbi:PO113 protein, partial [Herpetotheres cachinnans]|nr:PO113 protein [Herpetotheres cachinnans]